MKYTSDIIALLGKVQKKCEKLREFESELTDKYVRIISAEQTKYDGLIKSEKDSAARYESDNFVSIKARVLAAVEPLKDIYGDSEPTVFPPCSDDGEFKRLSGLLDDGIKKFNALMIELNGIDVNEEYVNNVTSVSASRKLSNNEEKAEAVARELIALSSVICGYIDCLRDYFAWHIAVELTARVFNEWKRVRDELDSRKAAELAAAVDKAFGGTAAKEYAAFFADVDQTVNKLPPNYRYVDRQADGLPAGAFKYKALDIDCLKYIQNCPPLITRIGKNGECVVPLVFPSGGKCNVYMDVNCKTAYAAAVRNFIDGVLVNYLLSFPQGGLRIAPVDINARLDLGGFALLNKTCFRLLEHDVAVDPTRGKRAIENLHKRLEYNKKQIALAGRANIHEYNKSAANPLTSYVLVLTDFCSETDIDTVDMLSEIFEGGAYGVYSVVVNNKSVKPTVTSAQYRSATAKKVIDKCFERFVHEKSKLHYVYGGGKHELCTPPAVDFETVRNTLRG